MIPVHEEYLVDEHGNRKAVVLPISEWQQVLAALEDLDDVAAYDQARAQPSAPIPFEQAVREIRGGAAVELRTAHRENLGAAMQRVPQPDQDRLIAAIRSLSGEPRPVGAKKLRGREAWRIRVGDYRVIYEVDDGRRRVLIVTVGHRRDIYRR